MPSRCATSFPGGPLTRLVAPAGRRASSGARTAQESPRPRTRYCSWNNAGLSRRGNLDKRQANNSERHRDPQGPRRRAHSFVERRELHPGAGLGQVEGGGEVDGVQCSHRDGERLEHPCEHDRRQLHEQDPAEEAPHRFAVGAARAAAVHPGPHLVLQQPARNYPSGPDPLRSSAILGKEVRHGHEGIEVDHLSARSASCSARISASVEVRAGDSGGGPGGNSGGVASPLRTRSASTASATSRARPARGGTSSATTLSRSEMRTVSPCPASRTYSLSLFLRTLMPTMRTA